MDKINYRKRSTQLAIDMVNRSANTHFQEQDIEFCNIEYLEEGLFNTRATIRPKVGSGWQEEYTIEYDRLNIQSLFKGNPAIVKPANQKKLSDYLPLINEQYSLQLTDKDIDDGLIPTGTLPPFKLLINISKTNPAFYGQLELIVSNVDKSIRRKLEGKVMLGIQPPTSSRDLISGQYYSAIDDWSELSTLFSTYQVGEYIDDRFINEFNLYDKANWVIDVSPHPFNLFRSKICFNGIITEDALKDQPFKYQVRERFTHLFVIELNSNYCTNVSGYLLLHYMKHD